MKKIICLLSVILCAPSLLTIDKLAVLIVIDGLSFDIFQKAIPHFSKGFKFLIDNGTFYTNAHYNYACTSTGPGHTTISTGCWPTTHGIIDNAWFTTQGEKINCDDDPEAALIADKPITGMGKSGHLIMTDGIADQLNFGCKGTAIAISNKPRSAICLSGHTGKAIWFNIKDQQFISSKAYFSAMPSWLTTVNKNLALRTNNTLEWTSYFPADHNAYKTTNPCYAYAVQDPMINNTIHRRTEKKFLNFYVHTPAAGKTMFDCAQAALNEYVQESNLLLCIGLDNVDKVGHKLGPDSFEYIDLLYHIDHQLNDFYNFVTTTIKPKQLLVCITADHGHFSIPELLADQQFRLAKRILEPTLLRELNAFIKNSYSLEDLILKIDNTAVYINRQKLATLSPQQQHTALTALKNKLETYDGIKKAWTVHELTQLPTTPDNFLTFYKNQLFDGRTALIQIQLFPYTLISKLPQGTSHTSPYNYTTHVPVLLFHSTPANTIHNDAQPEKSKSNNVTMPVWITQIAPTIAHFFSIQKPSACLQNLLPVF